VLPHHRFCPIVLPCPVQPIDVRRVNLRIFGFARAGPRRFFPIAPIILISRFFDPTTFSEQVLPSLSTPY
jgi:hypothetical protein